MAFEASDCWVISNDGSFSLGYPTKEAAEADLDTIIGAVTLMIIQGTRYTEVQDDGEA